ncbi:Alpha/beta hydrolase family [Frankia sp. AiPs1]|uniref:alpha/beta hydrolase n=1 Tax=Frankia sp. AiPa1 TaxID=573492 RepID=UPI00202AEC18|nr:alpha/beta hydrolase [Frankia sp. AiPa1]MCL9761453.1 alpha/beta hydrolase [Frankia sp. AiPa1]
MTSPLHPPLHTAEHAPTADTRGPIVVPPGPRRPRPDEAGPPRIPAPGLAPRGSPAARPAVQAVQAIQVGHTAQTAPSARGVALARREVRSVVAILPGRGQDSDVFAALADRLALDGHQLTVVTDGANRIPAVVETRVPGVPFVLLGADTGALAALAMVGSPAVRPDGLVLLGLPSLHTPVASLPVAEPLPRALPDLPILLIHGAKDEVSPLSLVRMTTRTASRAELAVVSGGHDLLAGPGRRSVAARTLLFLESLPDA